MNDHHDPNKYNLNHLKERLRQKPEVADFLDEITANPKSSACYSKLSGPIREP